MVTGRAGRSQAADHVRQRVCAGGSTITCTLTGAIAGCGFKGAVGTAGVVA